jgi:hypothetical protein
MKCKNCKKTFTPINRGNVICSKECLFEFYENKSQFEKLTKKIRKEDNKEIRKAKIDLMSIDAYRAKILQPLFNKCARLVDFNLPCIATNKHGKMNGGHYISVGANRSLALNLHNIHRQAFESNHFKSGDTIKYEQGIEQDYGIEYLAFLKSLKATKPIKLNKGQMYIIKSVISDEIKELEAENLTLKEPRSPKERIEKRNEINRMIGIYGECYKC